MCHSLLPLLLCIAHILSTDPAIAQLMAGGASHAYAVCGDGTLRAWGGNGYGMLGTGTTNDSWTPIPVNLLTNVTAVSTTSQHGLALTSTGTLWSWGRNGSGEMGNGTMGGAFCQCSSPNCCFLDPTELTALPGMVHIAGGLGHFLSVDSAGTVWTWGLNSHGQLGDGTTTNDPMPSPVSGPMNVTALAGGGRHSLALDGSGHVWAWGLNDSGQLGLGLPDYTIGTPTEVPGLSDVIGVAAGGYHSVALKSDGTVWAWGDDSNGQLGDTIHIDAPVPAQVSTLSGIVHIDAGEYHSLAVRSDGTVRAWGSNYQGQLGDGLMSTSGSVTQVSGLTNAVRVAAADYCSFAALDDGSLWAWGLNWHGQLGDGTDSVRSEPVPVSITCPLLTHVAGELDPEMRIHPNPGDGRFTIERDARMPGPYEIVVRNALGKQLRRLQMNDGTGAIDLSSEPDGIYFLSVATEHGPIAIKLVKQ